MPARRRAKRAKKRRQREFNTWYVEVKDEFVEGKKRRGWVHE
jgi:hypothetical protein